MSKPASTRPSSATPGFDTTPVPSSPPASESFFSEFDGTASVLDTSYGDGAAWEPPENANALNIVSWKLGVDAHVEDGVGKRGFNAISTVLNHPTKRANPLRASRKPLPPLGAPPLLPKPPTPAFYDGYLKTIAPLYETFLQSQAAALQPQAQSELDLQTKTSKGDLPSLDSIPEMFFDPNFDIANPSSWAEVMDGSKSRPGTPSSSKGKGRDDGLQDTLSTHLDNLERHLVHEITLRSSSFFSALTNLQDLNSESSSCLKRISDLKSALGDVGGKQAKKGLQIIDAQARLRALRVTEGGIKRVAELDEILRVARGLADGGDWSGALGCVEDVVRWWERNGKEPSESESSSQVHLPLNTLPALSNLPTSISALTSNVAGQLEGVLSATLLSILSDNEDQEPDAEALRNSIGIMLGGLVRCGKANDLGSVWRGAVTLSIREGLRQHLPITSGQDENEVDRRPDAGGKSLANKLQEMAHAEFVALCKKMYKSMLARLKRVQWMGEEMASILSQQSSSKTLTLAETSHQTTSEGFPFEPADILTSACELANTRASKIVMVRAEQHAELSIEEYVEIFNETWSFVVATETLTKRMIASLRGVAAAQTRSFLVSYHGQRLTKSARLVEEETWVQVDVPPATQHAVDLFVEAAVSDPAECFIPPRPKDGTNGSVNGKAKAPSRLVNVEDKSFSVVKATAESLTLLGEYLAVVINLELVVTDVMSRIIEFLKSFNSRTCQVVLGAGAMRSAGLRNITAKHLALASQSLSVVIALIPYIREFIRRHLNPRQAVMLVEFDKLKRDYQEHQNEIHAKLVAIMADRLAVHVAELREIDWEAAPAREGPHGYALMLAKETATLHKVLSKYLAPTSVDDVLSQVIQASVTRLSEEYSRVDLRSEEAKKRMLQDAALIVSRLGALSESNSAASLEAVVRDKVVPRKPIAQAVQGLMKGKSNETAPSAGAEEVVTPIPDERPEPQRQGSRGWREIGDADEASPSGARTPVSSSPAKQSPPKTPLKEIVEPAPVVSPKPSSLPSSPRSSGKARDLPSAEAAFITSKGKTSLEQDDIKPEVSGEFAMPTTPPVEDATREPEDAPPSPPSKDVDDVPTPPPQAVEIESAAPGEIVEDTAALSPKADNDAQPLRQEADDVDTPAQSTNEETALSSATDNKTEPTAPAAPAADSPSLHPIDDAISPPPEDDATAVDEPQVAATADNKE